MVNKFLYPNGGSETYIFKLGKELVRQGHEVEYFGMEHPDRIVGNSAGSYTSSIDFHTGKLQKLLYPFKIIYSVEARKKIRLVIKQFKPDIVHLNNFNFQLTPSIIYEIKKYGIPIVYTAHDYQWICPNHMMLIPQNKENCFRCKGGNFSQCIRHKCIHNSTIRSMLGTLEAMIYQKLKIYDKVDRVICPSKFMKDKLKTNPLLNSKLVLLYNFIDKAEFDTTGKKNYVLYFGRYSEEKGVKTLLEVCGRLQKISFVFAGGGPLEDQIAKYKNILNLGFLKGDELIQTIANARFSVFPSEWYENCPFSVMESQKYGTPVIASNIGGVPELIKDRITGELYEAGNANQLEEKIRKLWEDTELCAEYRRNCYNIKFDSVEEYCTKLLEVYREVI